MYMSQIEAISTTFNNFNFFYESFKMLYFQTTNSCTAELNLYCVGDFIDEGLFSHDNVFNHYWTYFYLVPTTYNLYYRSLHVHQFFIVAVFVVSEILISTSMPFVLGVAGYDNCLDSLCHPNSY